MGELDALRVREEVLQAMYWLAGEGLADAPTAEELARFLAVPAATLDPYLQRFALEGYLEPAGAGYRMSERGRELGKRSFADEFAGLTGQAQRVVLVARDHVDVEVEDRLPGRRPPAVHEVHAVGAEALARAAGESLRRRHHGREVVLGDLAEVGGVAARDDEGVAAGRRVDVHERDRALVVGDDRPGQLARDDLAEDAVGIAIGHGGEAYLPTPARRPVAPAAGYSPYS
jgi:hypothetical protein